MARNKLDPCMLCDRAPCECNKAPSKPKLPAKKREVVDVELPGEAPKPASPRQNALTAMKAAAKKSPNAGIDQLKSAPVTGDDKADLERAIRALEPILHPAEKVRYQSILSGPLSLEERRERWRARFQKPSYSR